MKAASKGSAKRKRDEEESAQKKKKVSNKSVDVEPPAKKTKQAEAAEEPRSFASTAEWLESERWSQVSLGAEEDFYSTVASPNLELWLIKAPAEFDASVLADKELTVEHFTDLKPGHTASRFTVEVDGEKYAVQAADPGEYRQLIDIVPSTDEQRLLLGKPFERGFNITHAVEAQDISVVPVRPRPIVPQPSNLRRRFRPPGYVMTKKEIKEEEKMSKKHSKAVHVAKHTTPPLRPVPIVIKAGAIPPPEDESQVDEEAEEEEEAREEEEVPLERKKKKSSKEATKKSEKSAETTTPTKKKKKSRKSKGGKDE
jgi:hypothetical protein